MTILKEKIIRRKKISKEIVISLSNIGKKYTVTHEKPTLVENVSRALHFQKKEEYWALQNVNLQIFKGEKIGFYGPNGAGKTTLLKIIAGISTPTTGTVITKGKVISLIDLEAGFHPDLTGEENIFLNGLIIGMSKEEIKKQFKKIVNFADIGQFINAPLYTYSQGMKLRLGFSIAAYASPNIILLDEGLVVGDQSFQKKISQKIDEFFLQKKTVIVVTHWLDFLRKNKFKIISLKKGIILKKN